MGYTHYWQMDAPLGQVDEGNPWTQLLGAAKDLIEESGIPIGNGWGEHASMDELVNDSRIWINGIGDNGHETFLLSGEDPEWIFCKTAAKPYDAVVGAILLRAIHLFPMHIKVTSDGGPADWEECVTLYTHVFSDKPDLSFLGGP